MSFLGLTVNGIAVGLAFFIFVPGVAILEEYTALYLEQLGYSETFIGLATMLGLLAQVVGVPLLSYLADKYRARKIFFFFSILTAATSMLLVFAAPIPQPICDRTTKNNTLRNSTIVSSLNTTDHYNNGSLVVKSSPYVVGLDSHNYEPLPGPRKIHVSEKLDSQRIVFFVIFLILRGIFELTKRFVITLIIVAAITHLKENKSRFGWYTCWGTIGGGIALFISGMSLKQIRHNVCGKMVSNYVVVFFFVAGYVLFTLLTLPFIKMEYHEQKTIDYKEVKGFLTTFHYIFTLAMCCLAGWFRMFHIQWEFWYIHRLGGSTVVMAVSGLFKRMIIAVWFLLSPGIINYFTELKAIAFGFLTFSVSFFILAFIKDAWLIIPLDISQAFAFVVTYASFVIHFSKLGSKATAVFFQGKV